jgi:hypothetical protein
MDRHYLVIWTDDDDDDDDNDDDEDAKTEITT